MIRQSVNEGSTAYLEVDFLDKDDAAATPSAVTYRIDCLTTGAAVRASTSLTAGSSIEITMTPADNAIQDQANDYERRLVTVEATYGASDSVNSEHEYVVRNLRKVA